MALHRLIRIPLIAVLAGGLTVGGLYGYRLYEQNAVSQEYKQNAVELVSSLQILGSGHTEAIAELDSAHDAAFEQAYDFGSFSGKATTDEQVYIEVLLETAWKSVRSRPDTDATKCVIYLLARTRGITVDGAVVPRNAALEALIREGQSS